MSRVSWFVILGKPMRKFFISFLVLVAAIELELAFASAGLFASITVGVLVAFACALSLRETIFCCPTAPKMCQHSPIPATDRRRLPETTPFQQAAVFRASTPSTSSTSAPLAGKKRGRVLPPDPNFLRVV